MKADGIVVIAVPLSMLSPLRLLQQMESAIPENMHKALQYSSLHLGTYRRRYRDAEGDIEDPR